MPYGRIGLKIVLLAAMLFVLGAAASCMTAEKKPLLQKEVLKRDSRWRVQVMGVNTSNSACLAEITYDGAPRIHIVVITPTRLENIGYAQVIGGTEENLSDAKLMDLFNEAISKNCLPLIVPGYIEV